MAKSYVPQMLYLMQRLANYITKHRSTIFVYITDPTVQADITSCLQGLNTCIALINRPRETP